MLKKILFSLLFFTNSILFAYTCPDTDLRSELQNKINKLREASRFIDESIKESNGEQIRNSIITGLFITLQTADFTTNFIGASALEKQGAKLLVSEFKSQIKIVSTAINNGNVIEEVLRKPFDTWSILKNKKVLNKVNLLHQGYQLLIQSWEIFEETSSINTNIKSAILLSKKFKNKLERQISELEHEKVSININCR